MLFAKKIQDDLISLFSSTEHDSSAQGELLGYCDVLHPSYFRYLCVTETGRHQLLLVHTLEGVALMQSL